MLIRLIKHIMLVLLLLFLAIPGATAQDAKQIVEKAEEKYRGVTSAISEVTLTIKRPRWTRQLKMKSWSKGYDHSMVLITYPANEKGTAFLKKNEDAWNWVPSIERTIKLSPSMMMQSWMGSDFTNDDFVRESSLVRDYDHSLLEEATIGVSRCHTVQLIPKPDAAVVWGKVILYIDKAEYIQMKGEMYDEDGELVKVMHARETAVMDGRKIATRVELIPMDKDGFSTTMEIEAIEFDRPISDSFFTTQNMRTIQ
jgi:outer membrane lipoprotein-sorting protein